MLIFSLVGLRPSLAQTAQDSSAIWRVSAGRHPITLSQDDRRSIIATARALNHRSRSRRDCSHLVHSVYSSAGFPYRYASSAELYRGTESFERVSRPQPGDLIVWQGHAGIVLDPARHLFFSALRYGPGIDSYNASYWRRRGTPRFYRYLKA
jgi:cell wall-associated NlpC family hydrolase